ncbi:hypothetical protein EVAR_99729_1 [Eumeta japonica]|uniref:Uncharacterized protein n=1 Tax=Eumeta variegata TaxID=151549 RepID=A0A4C1Z4Z9_EUMVA|nr:hypothetical protein EVAR_99729_1 [Eumeta japonica]
MELEGSHRNSVIKRCNPIEFRLVRFVLTSTLILYGNQSLMMELEGGHRNSLEVESESVQEERSDYSASETEDILETEIHEDTSSDSDSCRLQSSESDSDVNVQPRSMMELEGGHRNSVIKRRNPIEFGLV